MCRSFGILVLACLMIALGGCSMDVEPLDLRSMKRAWTPNDALACPADACAAEADFEVPVFEIEKEALGALFEAVATAEDRTELVAESLAIDQRVYVQRSETFGFPDTVRVQIVSLPEGVSAILYSRSRYGFSDLGVNRRRLRRWVDAVVAAAETNSS